MPTFRSIRTRVPVALALVALPLLAPASAALAQDTTVVRPGDRFEVSRYVGQLFLSMYSRETDLDDREWAGGIGGRVIIRPTIVEGGSDAGERTSRFGYGGFLTFTSAQGDLNSRSWHLAAQGELHPWELSLETQRLDPFASLAVGIFRTSADAAAIPGVPSGTSISSTDFAVTPGIGAYYWITPRFGLRGDFADVIVFGDATRSNWTLAAGVALSF